MISDRSGPIWKNQMSASGAMATMPVRTMSAIPIHPAMAHSRPQALWAPLLASGPIEVSIFGDVKADDAIKAVAANLGAIPARKGDTGPVPPIRFPAHVATPVVRTHGGPADQASAVIAWPTGGGSADDRIRNRLDVLAQVFSDRLFDRLRSLDISSQDVLEALLSRYGYTLVVAFTSAMLTFPFGFFRSSPQDSSPRPRPLRLCGAAEASCPCRCGRAGEDVGVKMSE